MANPDVKVNISDTIGEFTDIDFSLILIVSGDGSGDYKEYSLESGIANSGIDTDYATSTDTYKKAATIAMQKPAPSKVAIIGCSGETGTSLTDKLNQMLIDHDTFFRVITSVNDSAEKLNIAKWAVANDKMPYIQYDNGTFSEDYSTIPVRLLLHKTADEHLDAAEAGYSANLIPGTFILKFRTYEGISPEKLTSTEKTAAESKNMGHYIKVSGINMQRSSKTSNHSASRPYYVDDVESRIYTKVELQNKLLDLLVKNKKIGGDTRGLQMIEATMENVFENNYALNIIASTDENKPNYALNTDKAIFNNVDNSWSGINFSYVYLHGTEEIEINGTVS